MPSTAQRSIAILFSGCRNECIAPDADDPVRHRFSVSDHRKPLPKSGTAENAGGKPVWILAGIFGGLNLAALLCFYRGLNLLADHGCASVGYPMGQGLGIALFFVAGCIKNIPGTLSLCGFFLVTAGIASFVVNAFLN